MNRAEHHRSNPGYQGNRILEAIPAVTRLALVGQMEYMSLPVGRVLYHPREVPRYVHFLTSGLVSIATPLASGDEVDVGLIGSEGLIEAVHLLGASEVATAGVVQVEATALRAPYALVQKEFQWVESLRHLVLQQVQEQSLIATQLVACNAIHSVEARLARWLLMIADRLGTSDLQITQNFLAEMVAARRPTVTVAAGKLQRKGAIRCSRANIEILHRPQLESLACECYTVMRRLSLWLGDPLRS